MNNIDVLTNIIFAFQQVDLEHTKHLAPQNRNSVRSKAFILAVRNKLEEYYSNALGLDIEVFSKGKYNDHFRRNELLFEIPGL
jgi:hypothetical protein